MNYVGLNKYNLNSSAGCKDIRILKQACDHCTSPLSRLFVLQTQIKVVMCALVLSFYNVSNNTSNVSNPSKLVQLKESTTGNPSKHETFYFIYFISLVALDSMKFHKQHTHFSHNCFFIISKMSDKSPKVVFKFSCFLGLSGVFLC